MYEYKYVEVNLGGIFTTSEHYEIIDEHAKEGWRLVQIFPLRYSANGKPADFQIIFEREITN